MLSNHSSSAIVAVSDLDRARKFYGGTLGLELEREFMGHVLTFRTGDTHLEVYKSDAAGTNKANAVAWGVGNDIDAIVADLKAKGVKFEHYDMPDATLKGDIHVSGDMKTVWFKDPDGNILHLNNM